jgi:hypothetical protein
LTSDTVVSVNDVAQPEADAVAVDTSPNAKAIIVISRLFKVPPDQLRRALALLRVFNRKPASGRCSLRNHPRDPRIPATLVVFRKKGTNRLKYMLPFPRFRWPFLVDAAAKNAMALRAATALNSIIAVLHYRLQGLP